MNHYEYDDASPYVITAVRHALFENGVHDADITLGCIYEDGTGTYELCIQSPTATQAQCDGAVALAAPGSRYSRMFERIAGFRKQSYKLLQQHIYLTVGAQLGIFEIEDPKADMAFYESLVFAVESDGATLPQIVPCVNGGVACATIEELKTIVHAIRDRLEYVFTSQVLNGDGSASEMLLVSAAVAAITLEELEEIEDTRS